MATEIDIKKMKVSELKAQLEQRGQPTEGLKADLINRLQACLDEEEFGLGDDTVAAAAAAAASPSATPSAAKASAPAAAAATVTSEKKEVTATASAKKAPTKPIVTTTEEPKSTATKADDAAAATATAKKDSNKDATGKGEIKSTTTDAASSAPSSNGTTTADLSFEEKKRQRAERFNIPVVSSTKKAEQQPAKDTKRQKTGAKAKDGTAAGAAASNAAPVAQEKPLLPLDEIEKQLARASKYGGVDQARIDELKAMKRKHRFT